MKALYTLIFVTLVVCSASSQNYFITFAGTGASTSVDSVKVENLSQCTSVSLGGSDTLVLEIETGIREMNERNDFSLSVSPNPSAGTFSVFIYVPEKRIFQISVSDLSGKIILLREEILSIGMNSFALTGLHAGLYILKAGSGKYFRTFKLISAGPGEGLPGLQKTISGDFPVENNPVKSTQGSRSLVLMRFNPGDTLKLTGTSGTCRTVNMLFPSSSQTVSFFFVNCTDICNYHYAVVQIGTQLWMQENLKTTKYRDGSDIPYVADSATWGGLTTGAYCNFLNDPAEGEMYGRLYNFYAVDDSRGICPPGWHVPSTSEWNTFELFLDSTVDTTALGPTGLEIGRILKEGCDTRWQYWDTTFGLNSAGFTALCANFRGAMGGWALAPDHNHDTSFWTSTSYSGNSAWFRSLRWCYSDIYSLFPMKTGGNSVRCIKDN